MTTSGARTTSSVGIVAATVLVAVLPKCPLCLAAYLAAVSSLGIQRVPLGPLWAVTIAILVVGLAILGRAAWAHGRRTAFAVAVGGAALVLVGRWLGAPAAVTFAGVGLVAAGALRVTLGRTVKRGGRASPPVRREGGGACC